MNGKKTMKHIISKQEKYTISSLMAVKENYVLKNFICSHNLLKNILTWVHMYAFSCTEEVSLKRLLFIQISNHVSRASKKGKKRSAEDASGVPCSATGEKKWLNAAHQHKVNKVIMSTSSGQ